MALFYDRDYGYDRGYGRRREREYHRGFRGDSAWSDVPESYESGPDWERWRYDRSFRGEPRHARRWGNDRYDVEYRGRGGRDAGDPFNDRGSRTPFRLTRGRFRGADQRDYGWDADYDRDYSANPMGYDPYEEPPGRRGPRYGGRWRYDRGFRNY